MQPHSSSEKALSRKAWRPAIIAGLFVLAVQVAPAQITIPNLFPFPNPNGIAATFNTNGNGHIDTGGPFFQSLGSNGRSCASCHRADQAWSISADGMKLLFLLTGGTDPVFRTVDGSNCDTNINTSTITGRAKAYSLLTSRGLIRIALAMPSGADFRVANVSNPYGCNNTATLSMYRRPLPATNLKFLSTLM